MHPLLHWLTIAGLDAERPAYIPTQSIGTRQQTTTQLALLDPARRDLRGIEWSPQKMNDGSTTRKKL
jgi:hypothetical protein